MKSADKFVKIIDYDSKEFFINTDHIVYIRQSDNKEDWIITLSNKCRIFIDNNELAKIIK